MTLWGTVKPGNVKVEQRWFAGAHADVGGGEGGTLANLTLRWLQDTAEEAGLLLRDKIVVGPRDALGPLDDSYRHFMFGLYRWFTKPYHRVFGTGANEVVDESVWQRWRADPSYRPATLAQINQINRVRVD